MERMEKIRRAYERNAKAVRLRPGVGQGTAVTRVRVRDGLTCEVEEGAWRLVGDMPEKWGGDDRGPNPGVFGRAALGTCLAMGYLRFAAARGVPIASLEVEVQADYDARGELAVADVTPAYSEVRYVVTVESDAPEEAVLEVLDEADEHSPYLCVFREPIPVRREVRLGRTGERAEADAPSARRDDGPARAAPVGRGADGSV